VVAGAAAIQVEAGVLEVAGAARTAAALACATSASKWCTNPQAARNPQLYGVGCSDYKGIIAAFALFCVAYELALIHVVLL
jgi:hypothetical protein